jgi:hypothetical protein
LILPFAHDGSAGTIEVRVEANDDPPALGCRSGSLGLPACTATVSWSGRGYRAMFGWSQLVRSTDNRSRGEAFEMDPFALFAEADSPYQFYGHLPTLFDGPSRRKRDDMDWLAHAFLATTPLQPPERLAIPLAGFSWGFAIRRGEIAITPPSPLKPEDWRVHLPVLRGAYPNWRFAEGWSCAPSTPPSAA